MRITGAAAAVPGLERSRRTRRRDSAGRETHQPCDRGEAMYRRVFQQRSATDTRGRRARSGTMLKIRLTLCASYAALPACKSSDASTEPPAQEAGWTVGAPMPLAVLNDTLYAIGGYMSGFGGRALARVDHAGRFAWRPVEEAIARYGPPTILNTDQGSQFTSAAFTGCFSSTASRSAWTGGPAGGTTSSSNDSGAPSSTKRSTCTPTTPSRTRRPDRPLPHLSTTAAVPAAN